jgi:RNA polymerase sigma-70 factor (ECF subfamily)
VVLVDAGPSAGAEQALARPEEVSEIDGRQRFERLVLPHLDAAYNFARWLTRDDHRAQDIAQEAVLRALRFFGGFRGENARPWLLSIVRNTYFGTLKALQREELRPDLDDESADSVGDAAYELDPSLALERKWNRERVTRALERLPTEFREILVLREMEDLSYKQIADVAEIPIGTVMSRLSRARRLLAERLAAEED